MGHVDFTPLMDDKVGYMYGGKSRGSTIPSEAEKHEKLTNCSYPIPSFYGVKVVAFRQPLS